MSNYLKQERAFETAINRGIGHFRSGELDHAVSAIQKYIRQPSADHITTVRNALAAWRRLHPKEYGDRGAPIENDLRTELHQQLDKWGVPKAPATTTATAPVVSGTNWSSANVKSWVEARRGELEKHAAFACGDLLHHQPPSSGAIKEPNWNVGYARVANPARRAVVWARYGDKKNYPGLPTQSGMYLGRAWKAHQFSQVHAAVSGGKRGVCTTFAQASAHILTNGRPQGPRIEVVSWSGGHVFVLVNRKGGYVANSAVPDAWINEPEIVIVDTWLGSLGWPPIAYGRGEYRSGMVNNLTCVAERPAS